MVYKRIRLLFTAIRVTVYALHSVYCFTNSIVIVSYITNLKQMYGLTV